MRNEKQIFNPYLPSWEYIPDGEPHVFGDRIYLFGSHDRFDGNKFCMNDYVCYSADVHDLKEWRYEGTIYRRDQDPRNADGAHFLWAPDVTRGPDGRFYLYYCLDHLPQMGVAVCDTPAGAYEYLGLVRHADGTALGERKGDFMQFDPGVFGDGDGTVYLYSGMAPRTDAQRGQEHLKSQVMVLEQDMVTIKEEPKLLLPTIFTSAGTGFEGHEFFEASSMRKVNGKYYFIHSSVESQELCYCVSDRADGGFVYGGTLVSIGDIGLEGRSYAEALNFWGNTHGSMEQMDGVWYIFYHRHTNRTQFSRQACAEPLEILPDGSIRQAQITSCGLNGGPLKGTGTYGAYIACNLVGKRGTVMSRYPDQTEEYPFFTQDGTDRNPEEGEPYPAQYIANMRDGAVAGFKYFEFQGTNAVSLAVRPHGSGDVSGKFLVSGTLRGEAWGSIPVSLRGGEKESDFVNVSSKIEIPDGVHALYLEFAGNGALDLLSLTLYGEMETTENNWRGECSDENNFISGRFHHGCGPQQGKRCSAGTWLSDPCERSAGI